LQCSTKAIASSIVSDSYEGETFVMKSKSFVQFANCLQEPNNRFFVQFIKTETQMSKREKPKTAVDTKTEKPGILSAKIEKPISKVTQIAKPKNLMPPSKSCYKYSRKWGNV